MRRVGCKVVAALAVFLALAAGAAAQTETGRISGTVLDATGGILPGATVTAKAVGTGATRTVTTDNAGQYVFANLPPGPYEVMAELSGFNPGTVKGTVTVGGSLNAEIKLDIAGAKENVNVVAEVPSINTTNSEVAVTINETQIRELPTITRNVYDLVTIAGAVSRDDTSDPRGTGYAINGQRSASTNILLDGSANNDEFDATVGQEVPLDSVQEFSVISSNFSAQYGRASGGIVNVATKSGTNNFRGTGTTSIAATSWQPTRSTTRPTRSKRASSRGTRWDSASVVRCAATKCTSSAISNTSGCVAPTR